MNHEDRVKEVSPGLQGRGHFTRRGLDRDSSQLKRQEKSSGSSIKIFNFAPP